AVIENVVVDERARKSSIGAAMMQYVIALARARGVFARSSLAVCTERQPQVLPQPWIRVFGYSLGMSLPGIRRRNLA
ncbi:MAG: GNAT family N-acetyltransferase, partial [Halobacteriota archaeon]